MTDFEDFLQKMKTDPSISLYEYSKKRMEKLIFRHYKKSSCSAPQKEVVKMDDMSPLSKSLLPPSWRSKLYPTTKKIAVDKILHLIECGYTSPDMLLTEKEKENERINIRAILEEMDPKRLFLEHPERVSFDDVDRMIQNLRYEFMGDPLTYEVEGMDPDVLRKMEKEISEFPGDPDLVEMETGIHYEIAIRWLERTPISVALNLQAVFDETKDNYGLELFICVPQKFAGAALLVASEWKNSPRKDHSFPREMLLVSTGKCFEESKDIKIVKSDRIHVFNRSARLFQAKDFSFQRKSDIIVYRTRTP